MKSLKSLLRGISESEIISLTYSDPRIKLKMIQIIAFEYLSSGQQVHYLDFDLQFSSMLQNFSPLELLKLFNLDIHVLQPSNDIIVPTLEPIRKGGLIIIDSFNTVQNLFSVQPSPADLRAANHRSSVFVSAIQQIARFYSKNIIVLNLTKSRPKKNEGIITWERNIVGGRMSKFKSDVILFAKEVSQVQNEQGRIRVSVDAVSSDNLGVRINDEYEIMLE